MIGLEKRTLTYNGRKMLFGQSVDNFYKFFGGLKSQSRFLQNGVAFLFVSLTTFVKFHWLVVHLQRISHHIDKISDSCAPVFSNGYLCNKPELRSGRLLPDTRHCFRYYIESSVYMPISVPHFTYKDTFFVILFSS